MNSTEIFFVKMCYGSQDINNDLICIFWNVLQIHNPWMN